VATPPWPTWPTPPVADLARPPVADLAAPRSRQGWVGTPPRQVKKPDCSNSTRQQADKRPKNSVS
jgi:hypothetical protein